jgi:hypothetical protein
LRAATTARLVVGAACLVEPGRVLGLIGGLDRTDARTHVITRVLGVRLLAQGVADVTIGPRTRVPDILVDVTHAASMVLAARHWPHHRRSAMVSAGVAAAIAVLDGRSGQGAAPQRRHGVRRA